MTVNALKRIPLGSYVEGLVHSKSHHKKLGTNKQMQQVSHTAAVKEARQKRISYRKWLIKLMNDYYYN